MKTEMKQIGPAEIELNNWALYAGYVPESVLAAYEAEQKAKVLKQTVEALDLVAVIKAINGIT